MVNGWGATAILGTPAGFSGNKLGMPGLADVAPLRTAAIGPELPRPISQLGIPP
jgi:hypothetical protein